MINYVSVEQFEIILIIPIYIVPDFSLKFTDNPFKYFFLIKLSIYPEAACHSGDKVSQTLLNSWNWEEEGARQTLRYNS